MKFNYNLLVLSLLTASITTPAMAKKLADEAGFGGEISFNTGYRAKSTNFNTDVDNTITSLDHDPEQDSGLLVFPLGKIAYTFGQDLDKQFHLGTAREDLGAGTLALEIGYKQRLKSGTVVNVSFLPSIMSDQTWVSPYELNTQRAKTDTSSYAYRLQLNKIGGSNFSLATAYGKRELDQDFAPDELKREANSGYIKASYRQFLSRSSFIVPSITYITNDAEGAAESFDSYKASLSYVKLLGRHQFSLSLGYTQRDFDTGSALFDHTVRADKAVRLFAAYKYKQFMNWQDWSLVALVGHNDSDSNISFYDSSNEIVSLGLNYQF